MYISLGLCNLRKYEFNILLLRVETFDYILLSICKCQTAFYVFDLLAFVKPNIKLLFVQAIK